MTSRPPRSTVSQHVGFRINGVGNGHCVLWGTSYIHVPCSHSDSDQNQLPFPKNGSKTEEAPRLANGAKMQVSRVALAMMGHVLRMPDGNEA